jgi:hypothetical protein
MQVLNRQGAKSAEESRENFQSDIRGVAGRCRGDVVEG